MGAHPSSHQRHRHQQAPSPAALIQCSPDNECETVGAFEFDDFVKNMAIDENGVFYLAEAGGQGTLRICLSPSIKGDSEPDYEQQEMALVGADVSDDWMDWECPGFPCSVVNYFDSRNQGDFKQACTPLSTMYECSLLIKGENYAADYGNGTIAGWHNSTKPHPCKNPWGGCEQISCLQGTNAKCKTLCDELDLIFPYHDRCYRTCDKSCSDTDF